MLSIESSPPPRISCFEIVFNRRFRCSVVCAGDMCPGEMCPGLFVLVNRCPGKTGVWVRQLSEYTVVLVDMCPDDSCPGKENK